MMQVFEVISQMFQRTADSEYVPVVECRGCDELLFKRFKIG